MPFRENTSLFGPCNQCSDGEYGILGEHFFKYFFSEKMKSLRGLKNKTTDKDLAKDPTTTCQVNFGAHGLKFQETKFKSLQF